MDEPKAYVPGFDYDIFISYAHVDDQTASDGEKGWVERFHDHLVVKLGQRFGRADRVRIWRDPNLTGNERFDDVIRHRINRSALFLSLTSLGHLRSNYCRQEIRWFHDHSVKEGPGLRVGERMRFFNVLLYNVPFDDWPPELGRTSGFPFYRARNKQDIGRPLDPDDPDFQDRLWELVDAIYRTLGELKPTESEDRPEENDGVCDVYLAAVADSLRTTRRRAAEELVHRGFTVRDNPPPPYDAEGHRDAARVAIERARLSVHLLDGLGGAEIDGDEKHTYPREQVELGREHAASQMIWVPRSLDPKKIGDETQATFLDKLEHGERGERPYDFVRGGTADLADDIAEKLRQLTEAAQISRSSIPAVLLDVQRQDELFVLDLSRALLERQIVPYINPQENDTRKNGEILRARLRQVGALIVVYGRVHHEWVCGRLEQAANVVFSEGYPLPAFCVYLAPSRQKKVELRPRFPQLNLLVLDNRDGFDPETLEPLFEDLGRPPCRGNPFVGLRPFESDEALRFFGRREQTAELLELLHRHRFIGMVGSSGCGKSSLVRAGLIPNLKAGMLVEDRDRWLVAVMRPGSRPRRNLAAAVLESLPAQYQTLDKTALDAAMASSGVGALIDVLTPALADDANLLLLVDQFEEIFRFGEIQEEASDFVSLILALAAQRALPVFLVMTMRSDFLGSCDAFRGLPEALNDSQYLVPRLTRRQRREAIEGPVRLFGGEIASRLVDRLLNDAGDESDELPVLQHALMRLWEKAHADGDGEMDLHHYTSIGTLDKALSRHAEEALKGMDSDDLELAESVFRALTLTDANNRTIRRPQTLAQIMAETGAGRDHILAILGAFRSAERSFLVPPAGAPLRDESLIDISHESLIRQWERLREWVDAEDRDGAMYRRLVDAARRYTSGEGGLLMGRDLELALVWRNTTDPKEAWADRYGGDFPEAEGFLDESRRQHMRGLAEEEEREKELERARDREKKALQQQVRQARRFTAVMASILLVVLASLGLAIWKWLEAGQRTLEAQERTFDANYNLAKVFEEKAGAAMSDRDYQRAWLFTLASLREEIGDVHKLPLALGRVVRPELRKYRQLWSSPITPRSTNSVAFSPDGQRLASGAWDNSIRLWDMSTGAEVATLTGHEGTVTIVAFSPDGQRLASGSWDESIRLWDVSTGTEVARLTGHTGFVSSLAFSPDGRRLASGSWDNSIRLWDVSTGTEVATLTGHAKSVSSVAFSPDGQRLASGSSDSSIRLWDVSTGTEVATLTGHTSFVLSVAFSPDGQRLASGAGDNTILLWDMSTGAEVTTLTGHTNSVSSVAFSPDGQRLASGSDDSSIRLWDVSTGAEVATMTSHMDSVSSVAFSPDGQRLAPGSDDNSIRLWDVSTGAEMATLTGHANSVNSVTFSPDGQRMASGSDDNSVRLWDVSTGAEVATLAGHTDSVLSVAISPDGHRLATGSDDNSIRLWDVSTGAEVATLAGHTDPVLSVAISPDGQRLASGSDDNSVRLWDMSTGAEVATLTGHTDSVYSVAFSPDGQHLASGSDDNSIRLWNVVTGAEVATLVGHPDSVYSVAFSPDGQRLAASGYGDNRIRLWDVPTGVEVATLTGHTGFVHCVVFSPDGQRLASGSEDNSIRLWDVATGAETEVVTLTGHTDSVLSVAFSPDGRRLASGSDSSIRLWDVSTDTEVATLTGHTRPVLSVAFSPDGRLLASGSQDTSSVRLWDVSTGAEVATLTGHARSVSSVAFSPDGQRLASGSWDSSIRLWDVSTGAELVALTGHTRTVSSIAFSQNGQRLASGSEDSSIRLWDVSTGAEVATLTGHARSVSSVAFSPDGQHLASGSWDSSIRLWNASTGAEMVTLTGHANSVYSVAFSPDGRRLASGTDTGIRLWDVSTGAEVATLTGHTSPVLSVAFSPDGRRLASGSHDTSSIRLWDVSTGAEVATLTGHTSFVSIVAFSPDGQRLASGSWDNSIRLWDLGRINYFELDGKRAPTFDKIYQSSFYLSPFELEGFKLEPKPRPLFLTPVGGYTFPEPRPFAKLDRPRPPGKDPLEWMVENMD